MRNRDRVTEGSTGTMGERADSGILSQEANEGRALRAVTSQISNRELLEASLAFFLPKWKVVTWAPKKTWKMMMSLWLTMTQITALSVKRRKFKIESLYLPHLLTLRSVMKMSWTAMKQ